MTVNGLKFIADKLNAAGIPYCFEEWTKDIQYPYFVGSYTESEPVSYTHLTLPTNSLV